MNRRLHAGTVAAFFSWRNRRPSAERTRLTRPYLDRLEPRRLLASVAELGVPSGSAAAPDGMTAGPGGSIWFTEYGADKIGTINPSTHAISEFQVPTPNAEPFQITLGPDGNLWFTEYGVSQIGMINPVTDKITEFELLTPNALPFGITAGPDNTVWFTEAAGNRLGSIDTTTRKVTEYPSLPPDSVPEGITLGSDGNIWFTESHADQIDMVEPCVNFAADYAIASHQLSPSGAEPDGITTGPGGNLYFTEYSANAIGIFSLSSSTFSKPISIQTTDTTEPTDIAYSPDGNLWFTQSATNQVAMLNPATQAVTEFTTPSVSSGPRGIAAASDGSIWFAELNSGKVATIAPNVQITVTTPPPLDMKLGETFGLTVAVEFASGAVDTGYDGNVNLALLSGPAVSSLVGTTTVTAVNGVASFDGLSLVDPGSYSIQVKSGSAATATIGPISVTGPTGTSPVNPRGTVPSAPVVSAPVVLSEQLVTTGKGKNRYITSIVLTFSSALDPATARNTSNYTVIQSNNTGRAKALKPLRLHAVYSAAKNTVKLTLVGKPRFTAGGQLVVVASGPAGIASASGVHLEGNMGNLPGADAVYTILPNGRGIDD